MILVTGGCGYVGSALVPKLLALNHHVTVVDIMWFGNFLERHRNLTVLRADIRNFVIPCDVEAIIHLAGVANDPCGELDPKLSWEINALATMRLADSAFRHGIKRFIYASSGSVYGVKAEEQVTEDLSCEPLSEYNKTKMVAERVLLSYPGVQIIRPATVCGISPRMRLDVVVNMLTMQAMSGKITVLGGSQIRPNIHIDDMTDLYVFMLDHPELTGVYNAGFENLSILEIAGTITGRIAADIEVLPSADPRSYRMNSDKLLNTGFRPKKTVSHAITEIIESGIKDEPRWYNLQTMPR